MDAIFVTRMKQGARFVNQMGTPYTRQDWLELRAEVDAYFRTNPDEQIEQERQAFYDQYFSPDRPRRIATPRPPKPKAGYIYLLHGNGTTWYKIGISRMPNDRKKTLDTQAPFKIETVAYYDTDDMLTTEAWWHEYFAAKRKHGEWFELTHEDIELFVAQEGRVLP